MRVTWLCSYLLANICEAVLKQPLQTSIAVEVDEFDDIEVEDKLHIVISVKDFRAIIQHAGITGNALSARYSIPARPIQLSYSSDAISCEFLIMTVGERGSNPSQKTKKGRKSTVQNVGPRLEAVSRRTSVAPSETPQPPPAPQATVPRPPQPNPTPHLSAARASASRMGAFDLRPSQKPSQRAPPATMRSESLFVEDDGWEPVQDDEDEDENARLEWDQSADPVSALSACFMRSQLIVKNPSGRHMNRTEGDVPGQGQGEPRREQTTEAESSYVLDPTQRLSDVHGLALFPD